MVLLTGPTGFLGCHILESLIENNYEVIILKRSTSNTNQIKHLISRVLVYDVDLLPLEIVFEKHLIDCVIHTACDYGKCANNIYQIAENNLIFGLKLLDASIKYKTKIFINTDTILPRDLNDYSLSKKQFVEWLRQKSSEIKVVNFKIEYIYGTSQDDSKFVPWFLSKLLQNTTEIELTGGEQKRDFIYVEDVVSALLVVMNKVNKNKEFLEFDVGTGNSITLKYFLEQLKFEFEFRFGDAKTKLSFGKLPYRKGEMMNVELDNSKLINLGWSPKVTLNVGLRKIINELK